METEKEQRDFKEGKIKKAKEGLYSRAREEKPIIGGLESKEFDVQEDWGPDDMSAATSANEANIQSGMPNKKRNSMTKNILIISLLFFIGALTFAFYMLYNGSNVSSADNIEMSITGPVSVDAGKEVSLRILIENKNNEEKEIIAWIIHSFCTKCERVYVQGLFRQSEEPIENRDFIINWDKKVEKNNG